MIHEAIYSVGVAALRPRANGVPGLAAAAARASVLYCDICRRWGTAGTTHVCWRNWRVRLSDLLVELADDHHHHR
jgi:hypothetical protein